MKKNLWIGLVVLVLMVAGGLAWRILVQGEPVDIPGLGGGSPGLELAKPQGLEVPPAGAYALGQVELGGKTVPLLRIPLDVWGGYAALFAANGGAKPNADSVFFREGGFAVELVYEDSAQDQLDGYVRGEYPVIWATMDSVPVLQYTLREDRRVTPQVVGLFDWSTGGDGIVTRQDIKSPKDLKGKKIITSGNTSYSFFLLWLLAQSDIAPSEVEMYYSADIETALEAWNKDKSFGAIVAWEPFVGQLLAGGDRLLINSRDANQLIADVYVARQDFVREQGDLVRGLVKGMLQGQRLLAENPEPVYAWMAEFFRLAGGAAEVRTMMRNVHIPNAPEAQMFFDLGNPVNAFKTYYMAQAYFQNVGALPTDPLQAEGVINSTFLEAVATQEPFVSEANRVSNSFNRDAAFDIADLENQRLVMVEEVDIHFEAQQLEFDLEAPGEAMRQNRLNLEKVVEQMTILGTTVVKLVGHLDTTRVEDFRSQGQQVFIEASAQARLISKKRAEFIKKLLIEAYGADPERIYTEGRGWDQPRDEANPDANRRVEVQFIGFE